MLYLTFNEPKEQLVQNINTAFEVFFKSDWLHDELVQEMIRTVDKNDVIIYKKYVIIDSPAWGSYMSIDKLSHGIKGLMLMYKSEFARNTGYVYKTSTFGDNCFPWIFKIAEKFDVKLYVNSYFRIPKYTGNNRYGFEDTLIKNMGEFVYDFVNMDTNEKYSTYKEMFNIL